MEDIKFSNFTKLCNFQEKSYIPDGFGGYAIAWENKYMAWAEILPVIPDKKSQGLKPSRPWTHRMRTRFTPRINSRMRVMYYDKIYEIDKIINIDERGVFYEIMLIKGEK